MKFAGFVNAGTDPSGDIVLVASGTGEQIPTAQQVTICENDKQFCSGSIVNKSSVEVRLQVFGFGSYGTHKHTLRPYENVQLRNLPVYRIGFISAEIAEVHVMLVKSEAETPEDMAYILQNMEFLDSVNAPLDALSGASGYELYAHTDINSATTTTIADPAADHLLKVWSVNVSSDGATAVDIIWTDSAGSSSDIIARVTFAGAGSQMLLLRGLPNPNGADGLLRATSTNTAVLDIDVVYTEVHNNQ